MSVKNVVFFGQATNTSGETINELAQSPIDQSRNSFSKMNVVINVTALTGTSPTMTFSVLENFGGVYVETAKSAAISSTGGYILCQNNTPNAAVTKNSGAFPALGSGRDKRVVTTAGGTVGSISADIYFAFFN